jgi:dihydrofolate synthase/folylpolyglutamate synthase
MSNAALGQWLQKLESLHPTEIDLGLERVAAVAESLDLLPVPQPVITVAGTNGKGSTVAVIEAVLLAAGRSVGTFTSPHLLRFNERVRVSGEDVSDAELVEAFEAIERARENISLTYFEFAALAALYVFRQRAPEVVVLEVGLGGRLDAVNIVDPSVAVITSIDLDHQSWLGDSRGQIALEKAGILRPQVAVIVADRNPPDSLLERIEEVGARPALFLGRDFDAEQTAGSWGGYISGVADQRKDVPSLPQGSVLPENIVTGLQAAALINTDFDPQELAGVIAKAGPRGRRQTEHLGGLDYVLDVAHNPASISKLVEILSLNYRGKRKIAVFSAMSDKDIEGMIASSKEHIDAWLVADQPGNERAETAAEIAKLLRKAGQSMISVNKNVRQALGRARKLAVEGDVIVVFGSFYTVAEATSALERLRNEKEAV